MSSPWVLTYEHIPLLIRDASFDFSGSLGRMFTKVATQNYYLGTHLHPYVGYINSPAQTSLSSHNHPHAFNTLYLVSIRQQA